MSTTNPVAFTPPMGWNSWDCYGASITEEELLKNARYMAEHLKPFGYEYIVADIQWYEPGADSSLYRPFVPLEMDEYSRLIPAVNRFPSSAGGKGFRPLSDQLHEMGLKFGIHILRGIPRQAVHANTAILGTQVRAREIAHPQSICIWNTDMYGVDISKEGAQAYYDSLFSLYASWGVDYVKVDDISFPYSAGEIEAVRRAISRCGREIVLSLSPGPAPLEMADHLMKNANLWRISADFWDSWEDLSATFDRAAKWSRFSGPGHWPDADMLPLGHLALRSSEHGYGDRYTRFTHNEQITLMTLWCMFRSPLMMGGELTDNDDFTLSLLTNPEVLALLSHSRNARELYRAGNWNSLIVWGAEYDGGGSCLALFNTGNIDGRFSVCLDVLGLEGSCLARDLWSRSDLGEVSGSLTLEVPSHGARLILLSPEEKAR